MKHKFRPPSIGNTGCQYGVGTHLTLMTACKNRPLRPYCLQLLVARLWEDICTKNSWSGLLWSSRMAVANLIVRAIAIKIPEVLTLNTTMRTAAMSLLESGLHVWCIYRSLINTVKYIFGARANLRAEWNSVLFTDKILCYFGTSDVCVRIRTRSSSGERFLASYIYHWHTWTYLRDCRYYVIATTDFLW